MASRTWTVREVLDWTTRDFAERGIDSPRLDAELLVAHALEVGRINLYLDFDRPLTEEERTKIRELVGRRREREPIAYILEHRDFYGRRFRVGPGVLIPRPDTETLVERALGCIPEEATVRVLDVGTGSGAIALTLAAERPLTQITATDVSEDALRLAAINAERLGLADRVDLLMADLIDPPREFDLIVSNPPYIPSGDIPTLSADVRDHEPMLALDGGKEGLDVVRALILRAATVTKTDANLLFEIGIGQAEAVLALASQSSDWEHRETYADLNRVPRVVHLRRT